MRSYRTATAIFVILITVSRAELSTETVSKVERGVVRIFNIGERRVSFGSGFVLNSTSHIGTNHHVIKGAKCLLVMHLWGNEVEVRRANIVAVDEARDMALIQMKPMKDAVPLPLGTAELKPSTTVWSAGFPGMLDNDESIRKLLAEELFAQNSGMSSGELARLLLDGNVDRTLHGTGAKNTCQPSFFGGEVGKVMQGPWPRDPGEPPSSSELKIVVHSAKISEGNSGGPLVNADGNVVGINTQGTTNVGNDGKLGSVDIGLSSFIEELVRFAGSHNVPVTVVTTAPARAGSSGGGLSTTHIAIIVISAVLAILAATLAIMRRKAVAESFTQYLRRGGNVTRLRGLLRVGGGADESRRRRSPEREVSVPRREPEPSATEREGSRLRTHAESFVLEGTTGDGHPVHLSFSGEMVDRSGGRLMIGRKRDLVHLWLDDASLSRQHAVIVRRGESLYLEDRESGNGTSVNGEKLGRELVAVKLKSGDRVQLGSVALTLRRTG